MSAMRNRIARCGQAALRAATASYDEPSKHVRIDFFFTGTSEDVDFEELEFGIVGEIVGDIWAGVETVGFAVIFDGPSSDAALANPARLYPA